MEKKIDGRKNNKGVKGNKGGNGRPRKNFGATRKTTIEMDEDDLDLAIKTFGSLPDCIRWANSWGLFKLSEAERLNKLRQFIPDLSPESNI